MVLSLCRGIELENALICSGTPPIRLVEPKFAFNVHVVPFIASRRGDVTALELWMLANARRGEDRTGMRIDDGTRRVFDAPARQLHADDMAMQFCRGTERGAVVVGASKLSDDF